MNITFNFSQAILEQMSSGFISAKPYRHIILNGLFKEELMVKVSDEIENFDDWDNKLKGDENPLTCQNKFYCSSFGRLPELSRLVIQALYSEKFLTILSHITNINNLIPDYSLHGGGIHTVKRGGFLKIHSDFNFHSKLKLHRRLNLLLYCNKKWQNSWGGQFEMWDKFMNKCEAKVEPNLGRIVIFETNDLSFHGHPDPLKCPVDTSRKSIALYYYSQDRSPRGMAPQRGNDTMTRYAKRKGFER